ncbi:ABC transporter ATP-binding protein [Selenomonadales bacterium OttesenSCG-928-I06]|nr:ABC transporter ATP-binding protein [Selenomonadales bacterium OttesenSCG-928-I06]
MKYEEKNLENLLEVKNLSKKFLLKKSFFGKPIKTLQAVDKVSFKIKKGQTLGLVGETGSGKSTLGRCIAGLYRPTSGDILFKDVDIVARAEDKELTKKIQMIFQDPYSSLNPKMTAKETIEEALKINNLPKQEDDIISILEKVGLTREYLDRFPHELSGGQCQRLGIARTLAIDPEFIICDEPISALDISNQIKIVNLLEELQNSFDLTYLFIAHDLAMVRQISAEIAVMYLGSIVEKAPADELYINAQHPYTKELISAIPIPDPNIKSKYINISNKEPASPINLTQGCKYQNRCMYKKDICLRAEPMFIEKGFHSVACHLVN